jgi:adenylosuccinate synthase
VQCVIGNGVVLSPEGLAAEMRALEKKGINVKKRLLIDESAVLILPTDIALDKASETSKGDAKIGTTNRGIGPAYEDKAARRALHFYDLFSDDFDVKLKTLMDDHNERLVNKYKAEPIDYPTVLTNLRSLIPEFEPLRTDVGQLLVKKRKEGVNILFEGAQGTGLDIDHGTYPFVTSSNTVAAAASIGCGVGPRDLDYILGIIKAYATRVGSGPFVAEQDNAIGDGIRERGHEFGSVTGRKRRCGWLDIVALRKAIDLNSISGFTLTKLDILDGLDEVCICTGYEYKGETLQYPPKNIKDLGLCKPIYETLPGWKEPTYGKTSIDDLPLNARNFLLRVEKLAERPIHIVSTGPQRDQTIMLFNPFTETLKPGATPLEAACKKAPIPRHQIAPATKPSAEPSDTIRRSESVARPHFTNAMSFWNNLEQKTESPSILLNRAYSFRFVKK